MKNYTFLFIFFSFWGNTIHAQIEVKINAYGFLYKVPYISSEIFMGDNFGLEIGAGLKYKQQNEFIYEKESMFFVTAKRYLSKNKKYLYDNIFVGLYLSGHMNYRISSAQFITSRKEPSLVIGGMIGRKWMYTDKIFMETNLGLGLTKKKYTFEPKDTVLFFGDPLKKKIKTDIFLSFLVGYRFYN